MTTYYRALTDDNQRWTYEDYRIIFMGSLSRSARVLRMIEMDRRTSDALWPRPTVMAAMAIADAHALHGEMDPWRVY